jgi:ABC-2 type transport system ATP-binding protein
VSRGSRGGREAGAGRRGGGAARGVPASLPAAAPLHGARSRLRPGGGGGADLRALLRTAGVVAAYTLVFFGVLPALLWQAGGALDSLLDPGRLRGGGWTAAGALLAVAGSGLMLWSMWLLRVDGGGWPISHLPPKRLVRHGPYAWMRHPIYVGYTLAFAGAGLLDGSPGRAVGATALLTAGWILYALRFEEPRLQRRLGAPSLAYREETPLLPGRAGPTVPAAAGAAAAAHPAPAAPEAGPPRGGGAEPLLAGRDLVKRYGRRRVLEGASLEVWPGEVIGIAGENGAGKSTLVRIVAGMLRPDAGTVRRPDAMGYAPQEPLLYEQLTPWEHFRYFAAARGIADAAWQGRASDLLDLYRFSQWRDERAANLSGGTRQKLNLALALLADPRVLLLDEPYGGFEWETYLRFWDHVREMRGRGRAVVVISHLFHERTRFDRLLELRGGVLVEAT